MPTVLQPDSLALRHFSLQYRTCSQHRSHFFRHANGRWHAEQSEDLPVRFYVARAVDSGRFQEATYDGIAQRLTGRGFPSLALRYDAFDTDHGGVVAPAFEAGLDFTLGEAR